MPAKSSYNYGETGTTRFLGRVRVTRSAGVINVTLTPEDPPQKGDPLKISLTREHAAALVGRLTEHLLASN
jgi:hypothetical protein